MYLKLIVNFRANTSDREKIKIIEEMRCLYKKESKKRVKVLVQELRKPSWIVPRTFFWKVSFLLDFIWAWKKNYTQQINTFSKSTTETFEQGLSYVQSLQ